MQNKLYEFIEIENIDIIKNELYNLAQIKANISNKNVFKRDLINECPNLYKFLKKSPSTYNCRFYFTNPKQELLPHIDGDKNLGWGLNIPVMNYENSETIFYKCDEDNMIESNYDFSSKRNKIEGPTNRYHAHYWHPLDFNKMEIIETFCMDRPCIFNTTIMHSMKNYNDKVRVMFLIRFTSNNTYNEIKNWI